MRSVRIEIRIEAPAERVFALSSNVPGFGDVVRGIERIEMLTDGPVGTGARWRETRVLFGKAATEEMRITGFDPPRSLRIEADSHGAHYVTTYRFTPNDGGTDLEMDFSARPRSFLARLMSAVFGRAMLSSVRKALEADLRDLKRVAEKADV